MYQVGEHVMYRNNGICTVEAVGKTSFSEKSGLDYYTLRPVYENDKSRFYVPVKADQFIRTAITKEETYQCLTELARLQTKPFCSKRPTELAEHYDKLLIGNDMIDHLTLYKELCQKEKTAKETGKRFGQLDSNYKNQVEKLLSDEFSCALGEAQETTKERLHQAVALS